MPDGSDDSGDELPPPLASRPPSALKNTLLSAVSNLSTAYNLVVINIVHVLLQNQYCGGDACEARTELASTASLAGAILGQLSFGYVGDWLGRSRALQLTMALSVCGALASALAVPLSADDPSSIFLCLSITRFVLGLGVGGVYPLSATIAAESAATASRGRNASLVFSMQGIANLLVPIVARGCVALFGEPPLDSLGEDLGLAWRVALGLGALPGLLMAPFRTSDVQSVRRGLERVELVSPTAAAPPAVESFRPPSLLAVLSRRNLWGKLVGTAGGWFIFDITFYGNLLFQPLVLSQVFDAEGGSTCSGDLKHSLCIQMSITALIGLPGYYVAVWLMDSMGRRTIQLQGFLFMALLFAVMGVGHAQLEDKPMLMLALYGMTFFFSNFGPNSTTFILPAETFPSSVRATLNGFCAAMGKLGATVGSAIFKPLVVHTGLGGTLIACSLVSLCGMVVTWFFVEDLRGKEMSETDEEAEVVAKRSASIHREGAGSL